MLLERFRAAAQVQVVGSPRAGQQLLQRDPVQTEDGRAERLPVLPAQSVGRDPAPVAAVTMDDLSELARRLGEAITQVEVLQHSRAVGGERDGRADLAQLCGLFEDLGGDAAAPQ